MSKNEATTQKFGLLTAGFVLSIIGVVMAVIPPISALAIVLGILAIIFASVAMKHNKGKNGIRVATLVLGILTVLIGVGVVSVNSSNNTTSTGSDDLTNEQVQQTSTTKKEKLTLDEGFTIDKNNPYWTYVDGYVTNNTDRAISNYIQIRFNAYDAEGASVGSCFDNVNNIDAGGKWKFHAMCTGDGITTVKFKDITGF